MTEEACSSSMTTVPSQPQRQPQVGKAQGMYVASSTGALQDTVQQQLAALAFSAQVLASSPMQRQQPPQQLLQQQRAQQPQLAINAIELLNGLRTRRSFNSNLLNNGTLELRQRLGMIQLEQRISPLQQRQPQTAVAFANAMIPHPQPTTKLVYNDTPITRTLQAENNIKPSAAPPSDDGGPSATIIVPCKARGMPVGHNFRVSLLYFDVQAKHFMIVCSVLIIFRISSLPFHFFRMHTL
jgi:hypothetical protein